MLSKHTYPLLAMLAATAIWGFAPPIIKHTLEYIPPFSFLFYRFLIVCIVMLPYMYFQLRRETVLVKDLPALTIAGLLSQASLILIFYGLRYTSSLEVAVIGTVAPLLMVGAGHYFFNDRVSKYIEAGLVLATVGTLILALGPLLDADTPKTHVNTRIWGNFLIVLYNFIYTADVLWAKRIRGSNSTKINQAARFLGIPLPRKKYSSQLMTGITFYVGLTSMLPFYILESSGKIGQLGFNILSLNLGGWAGLLYTALLSSIVAYICFEWSLTYLKVTDTVLFSYIAPVFTLPAAFIILGELPTRDLILGAVVVVLGILVAERKKG